MSYSPEKVLSCLLKPTKTILTNTCLHKYCLPTGENGFSDGEILLYSSVRELYSRRFAVISPSFPSFPFYSFYSSFFSVIHRFHSHCCHHGKLGYDLSLGYDPGPIIFRLVALIIFWYWYFLGLTISLIVFTDTWLFWLVITSYFLVITYDYYLWPLPIKMSLALLLDFS